MNSLTQNRYTIVLINHSFQINYFSRRWKLFSESHPDFEVYLLAPDKYEWYSEKKYNYGSSNSLEGKERDEGNFHIRLYRINKNLHKGWTSPDFEQLFRDIKPDIVYHIGTHNQESLYQITRILVKKFPHVKRIAFSMRGPAMNLRKNKIDLLSPISIARRMMYYRHKHVLNYIHRHIEAFFCHYPEAVDCFRTEGYSGPLYMQTQVGVNIEWFHEDALARREIREKYNLGDSFVFGSASRFTSDKGLDDILNALPKDGNWKYLMMGKGSQEDIDRLRHLIDKKGLQDKVIMTGFVDWYDMAKYWNAVDCAIHVPRTTPWWEETFSLSIIQAMITRKPIIGNTSGSVPYQIGPEAICVPEGDIQALNSKIQWVLDNQCRLAEIGEKMYERALQFTVQHLNDVFYDTLVEDVIHSNYDITKMDMTTYKPLKFKEDEGFVDC